MLVQSGRNSYSIILLIRKKLHPFLIQPDASTASTRDPGLAQT
jgi:hypothetical protein